MSDREYQKITIQSCFTSAKQVEDEVVRNAKACGYDAESIFALRLSIEEALTNAIRHGNGEDSSKEVCIRYLVTNDRIDVYIADEGEGFDPSNIPDPTLEENLQKASGRGIMLMRAYMSAVEYNKMGNEIHLSKLNKAS